MGGGVLWCGAGGGAEDRVGSGRQGQVVGVGL